MKEINRKNQAVQQKTKQQSTDNLGNQYYRVFFKTSGSSILIASQLTIVAAMTLMRTINQYIQKNKAKLNGTLYSVR